MNRDDIDQWLTEASLTKRLDMLRVLLIEDNADHQEIISAQIKAANPQNAVICCSSMKEGLAHLRVYDCDIVLLDLNLPDSKGVTTVEEIKRASFEKPMIVISSIENTEIAEQALKAGAEDFLHKSHLDRDTIMRSIRYAIIRNNYTYLSERMRQAESLRKLNEDLVNQNEKLIASQERADELMADLRWSNAELMLSKRMLENSNRELEQFAYVASHDLKAPLRGIAYLAQWIREDSEHVLSAKSIEHLTKLVARAKRMQALLDGLLDYSRVGRVNYEVETVSLVKTMRDAYDLCDPRGVFELQLPPEDVAIATPRPPLETVVRNLFSNAIKHHDQSRGIVKADVRTIGTWVEVAVSDDGPGIAPENREKVFEMFQTLRSRDEVEGSGVGLSIVRKQVESFGGRVWVTSNAPRGTVITFTWPKEFKA